MQTTIDNWPPKPSFMYSAMSEATSVLYFALYPSFYCKKLHCKSSEREFIEKCHLFILLLFYKLWYITLHFAVCLPLSPSLSLCNPLLVMSRFHESLVRTGYRRICCVEVWIAIASPHRRNSNYKVGQSSYLYCKKTYFLLLADEMKDFLGSPCELIPWGKSQPNSLRSLCILLIEWALFIWHFLWLIEFMYA